MAKEYFVEIGTRKRPARFTRAERIEIERRFNCDIKDFVYKEAFPLENGKITLGGKLEAQEALIYYAIRSNAGPKVTEDSIATELQEHVKAGGSIYKPLSEAVVALLASGVLGWHPPIQEDDEAGKDDGAKEATG